MSDLEDSSPEKTGNGLPAGGGIAAWWRSWQARTDWQEKLYRRAAHKSLDIPDDDMQINTHKSGIGALGLMGVALAAGLPGGLVAYQMLKGPADTVPPVITPPPQVTVEALNLKVRWWVDENGEVQSEVTENEEIR